MTYEHQRMVEALRDRGTAYNMYLLNLAKIKCSSEQMLMIVRRHMFKDHLTIWTTSAASSTMRARLAIEESTQFYEAINQCVKNSHVDSHIRCFIDDESIE